MSEHVEWTGKSGASYTFVVIPWPAPLDEGYVVGNYICARQGDNGDWICTTGGLRPSSAPDTGASPTVQRGSLPPFDVRSNPER